MLTKLIEEKLYVKVSRNQFEITPVSGDCFTKTISSPEPFSTSRLLVGEFGLAEYYLTTGVKEVLPKKIIKPSPAILIHPVEMTEGGLSEVEIKILREIALGAGAHKVVVWDGGTLTLDQVCEKLENA